MKVYNVPVNLYELNSQTQDFFLVKRRLLQTPFSLTLAVNQGEQRFNATINNLRSIEGFIQGRHIFIRESNKVSLKSSASISLPVLEWSAPT